jgi:hypothetical protein
MGYAAGTLYWHRQVTPTKWVQSLISTAVDGIICIALGDIDSDGDIVSSWRSICVFAALGPLRSATAMITANVTYESTLDHAGHLGDTSGPTGRGVVREHGW